MPAMAIDTIQKLRNTQHPISQTVATGVAPGRKYSIVLFPQGAPGHPRSRLREINSSLLSVLLAAQHDDPDKQDREHGANDSNCGSIHRRSPFLAIVNSAFPVLIFS
jgi:hypothetical protein